MWGIFCGRGVWKGVEKAEAVAREPGLTFRKAFFSKVFMMNGGVAASKDRPAETFISVRCQLAFFPTI